MFQSRPSTPPGRSTRAISFERGVGIEPVEGLTHQHGVDALVVERYLFGPAGVDRDVGVGRMQLRAHPVQRLHGDDDATGGDDRPGQLARARGQVEHVMPGRGGEHPVAPLRTDSRSGTLVGVGDVAEDGSVLVGFAVGHQAAG